MTAVIVPTSAIVRILDFIEPEELKGLEKPEEPVVLVELRVPADENCRRASRELYCIWGRSQANSANRLLDIFLIFISFSILEFPVLLGCKVWFQLNN